MGDFALSAVCSVRKVANIGSVTSRSTILVKEISQFSFSSDNISLFCSPLGLIPLLLC